MEFQFITTANILDFARECPGRFKNAVPVTPSRAAGQARNPFAGREDVLLIIAVEDKELKGFLGILPFGGGPARNIPLFWNSGWWTLPGAGAGVSLGLFRHFLDLTGGRTAFSDLSPHTAPLLEKMGYPVRQRKGFIIRLRSAFRSRAQASERTLLRLGASTGILSLADFMLNRMVYTKLKAEGNRDALPGFRSSHREEDLSFIRENSEHRLVVPGGNAIEWWEGSRWLADERVEGPPYPFRSRARYFGLEWFERRVDGKLAGLGLVNLRDGVMKTLYFWIPEGEERAFFDHFWNSLKGRKDVHSLVSFDPVFVKDFEGRRRNGLKYSEKMRSSAVSQKIIDELGYEPELCDGDGDYLFT